MNSNLISIIVPVYNVERYLDRCIESIVNQTYTNIEILLIDDGSPDNCPKICDEWAKKDNRIKVIHKENGGVSSARNMGIDIARGKYIGFIDGDDYIEKNMYEYLIECIKNNNFVDLSYCDVNKDNSKIDNLTYTYEEVSKNKRINEIFPFRGGVWNGLYRSDIIKQNDLKFNEDCNFGEDLIFVIKYLTLCSNKIIHVKAKLYNYILNENGVTQTVDEDKRKSIEHTYSQAVKFCYELLMNNDEVIQSELANNYINFIYHLFIKNKEVQLKSELITQLSRMKKYFNVKQRIYYILVKINPILLYYLKKIV